MKRGGGGIKNAKRRGMLGRGFFAFGDQSSVEANKVELFPNG
jgi:hypothetical protein